eukprot:m.350776 g.350776  ORF g.350776 m.350776 type:complete len:180 (+) comp27970_c1_seq20:2537-3076(+)
MFNALQLPSFSNLSAPLASSLVGSGVGGGPTLTPTVKSYHVVGVAAGLVYGSAEHDRCGEPDYYFNVNAWGWRGLVAIGRLHAGGDPLPPPEGVPINATWGNEIIAEAVRWRGDILATIGRSLINTTTNPHVPFFLPSVARSGTGLNSWLLSSCLRRSRLQCYVFEVNGAGLSLECQVL